MRVLVTGGAGFIGSNLVRLLNEVQPDWDVRVLDDLSTGSADSLDGLTADIAEGSILNLDLLERAVRGVDSIVHLAAIPSVPRSVAAPVPSHDANATGTLNVLEAARAQGIRQVIVASSSSVYGSNPLLPKPEETWTRPMSPYGVSKLATEGYALAYNFSYGMRNLAFRFFNVYGPGQSANHAYAAVIPNFLNAALSDQPLVVHGDGLQSRDFTYVDTVNSVIAQAIREGVASEGPINLAFGTNTTLMQLVSELETVLGRTVAVTHEPPRVGDVRASQADGAHLRALFPAIEPVPLSTGLAATAEWFTRTLSRP